MAARELLRAEGLGRLVPAGTGARARWIWRGLDLTVAEGESVAITGPSGSGKTLFLRALAGLDPVQEGTLYLEGRPLQAWPAPLYRSRVVYVAQRPALFDGTVEDNLARPFTLAVRRGHAFDRRRALEVLAALGRDAEFLRRPVTVLSGGEAQIVALARALLVEPAILLLDEPTASLDADAARRAEALIGRGLAAGAGPASGPVTTGSSWPGSRAAGSAWRRGGRPRESEALPGWTGGGCRPGERPRPGTGPAGAGVGEGFAARPGHGPRRRPVARGRTGPWPVDGGEEEGCPWTRDPSASVAPIC